MPRELAVPQTSLWFNLEVAARRYPQRPAYVLLGRALSYQQLHNEAEALAAWLRSQGVQRGDRVALFMQNLPQFVVAFYAAMRADAVVVPVNPMNKADEFGHYITDPDTRVVITSADLAGIVAQANDALPAERRLRALLVSQLADYLPAAIPDDLQPAPAIARWLTTAVPLPEGATAWADALVAGEAARGSLGPCSAGPDDLALLPYTSGTTGLPKGCIHPHRTLMHNAVGNAVWGTAGAETVGLGVVPFFHITGLVNGVLANVWAGATTVILPRWDRDLAGRLISRHRITHWTCIPTMVIDLFASEHYRSFDLSSLTSMSGGGAAMPQAVAERLQREFGITFTEGYGLTETAAPSHLNPPDRAKLQCLGVPFFGTDALVVDPVTLEPLPAGEVGEIVIHGPEVFSGYWKHPEATAAAFFELDGRRYFRSGDLGRVDEDGYFFITDRLKRMINASGYKVWPSEVELLLYKHPAVAEACIISARDEYRGETVKAVIVLREAARGQTSAEDIIAWSREHMAAYKVPRLVEFADALPKSGSGKVMWRLLQEKEQRGA
jgi:fatty-acyl-CoA synthase